MNRFNSLPPQTRGALHMAIASIFFFIMGIMIKLCDALPVSQIVLFRGVVAIIICLVQLRIVKISPWGNSKKFLIIRGLCGTAALFLFFHTMKLMPFASAVVVQYLSPIITTAFTSILLKEVFYKKQIFFFFIAFIGIICVKGFDPVSSYFPYLIGIAAAFCSAGAYTAIRKIKESEHPLVIIFYFPLITIPLITPFVIRDWVTPSFHEWFYLIGVGVFVQIAQYFMTRAYQLGDASIVALPSYLGVIWAAVGGYFFFNESISAHSLIGIFLVLFAIIGNTLYRQMRKD